MSDTPTRPMPDAPRRRPAVMPLPTALPQIAAAPTALPRAAARMALPLALVLALAACAGPQGPRTGRSGAEARGAAAGASAAPPSAGTRKGGYYLDDGPGENAPADLAAIPDAVPRAEPLKPATMQPYSVFGRRYTPMMRLEPYRERGMASWYGRRYHGQPTSSGEPYDMYAMTAAHPTLPIPSYVRVTRSGTGRSVVVRVNDRGPFLQDRVIDLSYTAAAKLGFVEAGSAEVEVELITQFDGAPPATTVARDGQAGAAALAAQPAAASSPSLAAMPASAGASAPSTGAVPVPAPASGPASAAGPASPQGETVAASASGEPARLNLETIYPVAAAAPRTEPSAAAAALPPAPPPASAPPPAREPVAATPIAGFWLQLGAFASLDGAQSALAKFARQLDWLGAAFDIRREGALYKVQAGRWPRREQALAVAERIRAATELRPFTTLR